MAGTFDIKPLLTKVADLLKGEPARAIGYGAAVIIYFAANAIGAVPDVTFDVAVVNAVAAIAIVASVVESIRKFVYSEPTVQRIADNAAATGFADVPAPPADAGV